MGKAFQDEYPEVLSYCYGCGRLNEQGLQIKSYWEGDETVCLHTPRPFYVAIPGYVYGGLLASLIDCHGTGTASAAAIREAGLRLDSDLPLRIPDGIVACGIHETHTFRSDARSTRPS